MNGFVKQPQRALLPPGFYDVLGAKAALQEELRGTLVTVLNQYGYQLVKPPLMEYENSLFAGAGGQLRNHSFQLMDPASHKLLGVRPDITTQIARIACSRFINEPRPLRLCYAGEVLRTQGEGVDGKRERVQVGFELIGADNVLADSEILLLAVAVLHKLGITDLAIDFILPPLVRELFAHLSLDTQTQEALMDALNKKDIGRIKELTHDDSHLFIPLVTLYGSVEDTLKHLESLPVSDNCLGHCARLRQTIEVLAKQYPEVAITLDASEVDYFHYHSGIGFSLFEKASSSELGRGGRYDIDDGETVHKAIGFTLYLDTLIGLCAEEEQKPVIVVPLDIAPTELESLHNDYVTVYALDESRSIKEQAESVAAFGYFENGKLQRL